MPAKITGSSRYSTVGPFADVVSLRAWLAAVPDTAVIQIRVDPGDRRESPQATITATWETKAH